MCMFDLGDGWKLHHSEERKARKSWRCYECSRAIEPGERHEYVTGILNGDEHWQQYRTCTHCIEARRWLWDICHGWLYGGVWEDIEGHWEDGFRSLAFGRLIVLRRRRWADTMPEQVAALAERAIADYRSTLLSAA